MVDLIIAYYAMGWVSCALNFKLLPEDERCPQALMLAMWLFLLPWVFIDGVKQCEQYWWNKPSRR